ncbi:MAG: TolC family protein [Marinifilaceae bacterium]|jgi:outer membrane protein|nr:TolC family protein [Marinilabiliaceae bacterium JC040]MCT4599846.1 TolC family protein [Marinifilaceae bacterium]
MRIAFRTLILILLFIQTGKSQETDKERDLSYCIKYAIENNLDLASQIVGGEIIKEDYKQSKRDLLPNLSASSTGNVLFGKSIDPLTNKFVNKQLFSTRFNINSEITLFRGFVNINAIKMNKYRYLQKKEDIKQKEFELAFLIMNNYYDYIYYKRLSGIVKKQVDLSNMNLKKINKEVKLGIKAQSDLLEIKAQSSKEAHNYIVAQNNMNKALLTLKKNMNYPLEKNLIVKEKIHLLNNIGRKSDDIYSIAIKHMPTIISSQNNTKAKLKQLAIARGYLSPSISLGGQYSTNYTTNDRIDFKNQFNKQIDNNASQAVYLSLKIPIFQKWNSRSRIKKAKKEIRIARIQEESKKLQLRQQIAEDNLALSAINKEIKQLKEQVSALKEGYTIAEKKLHQGLISIIEFYTSKNQYTQSQANLVRKQMEKIIKEKTISFYLGKSWTEL